MINNTDYISTLSQLPKNTFECIIWDLRHPLKEHIIGGKNYCNHAIMDKNNICELCGAYKGYIKNLPEQEYKQRVITEITISPATDYTIIITNRQVNDNVKLVNSILKTPRYREYCWLSCYGALYYANKQQATYLIFNSKKGNYLSQAKYIVNHATFDPRLLQMAQTYAIIEPSDTRFVSLLPNFTIYNYEAQK